MRNNRHCKYLIAPLLSLLIVLAYIECYANTESTKLEGINDNIVNTIIEFKDLDSITDYLENSTDGKSPDDPILLKISVALQRMTNPESRWQKLLNILDLSGKYVALDLSDSTLPDNVFNPASGVRTGKQFIVALTLPKQADGVPDSKITKLRGGMFTIDSFPFAFFFNLKAFESENLQYIPDHAFYHSVYGDIFTDKENYNKTKLKKVTLLNSRVQLHDSAFTNADGLTKLIQNQGAGTYIYKGKDIGWVKQ